MIWHHQLRVNWDSHEEWTFWRCLCLSRHGSKPFRRKTQNFSVASANVCKVSSHLIAITPWSQPSSQTWPSQTPWQTWWTLVGSGALKHYLFNTACRYGGCITKIARGHISQHRNVCVCVCVCLVCLCHLLFINEWWWMHVSWPFLPFRGVCEHLLGLRLY